MANCTADLHRQLCSYVWDSGGELDGGASSAEEAEGVLSDATVVCKAQNAANRFLERCRLPTKPLIILEPTHAASASGSADGEDRSDDDDVDDDAEEAAMKPQLVAFMALETQLQEVVHDCSALADAAKQKVVSVIRKLSVFKMALLLSPDTFNAADDNGVIGKIVSFDSGRLGLLLFRALGLLRLQTAQGESLRHVLRRNCARHCIEVAESTALRRLHGHNVDGALEVAHDLLEFSRVLSEETKEWYGTLPDNQALEWAFAKLEEARVRANHEGLQHVQRNQQSAAQVATAWQCFEHQLERYVRVAASSAGARQEESGGTNASGRDKTGFDATNKMGSHQTDAAGGEHENSVPARKAHDEGVSEGGREPDTGGDAAQAAQAELEENLAAQLELPCGQRYIMLTKSSSSVHPMARAWRQQRAGVGTKWPEVDVPTPGLKLRPVVSR